MITVKQWEAFTPERRKQKSMSGVYTFLPSNRLGIKSGHYLAEDLVVMLRRRKTNAAVVQFILDMLE